MTTTAASGTAMPTPRPTCCEVVRPLLAATAADVTEGVAAIDIVGVIEGTAAQAEPLEHVDCTEVPPKLIMLCETPRASASCVVVWLKLLAVSARKLALAAARAPEAVAGNSTGGVMTRKYSPCSWRPRRAVRAVMLQYAGDVSELHADAGMTAEDEAFVAD